MAGAVVSCAGLSFENVLSHVVSFSVLADQEESSFRSEAGSTDLTDEGAATDDGGIEYTGDAAEPDAQMSSLSPVDLFDNGFNYSAVIYDNKNGLPTSESNAIVQTSEGFIWIGGYGGLVRYDGNRFERVPVDGISGVKATPHKDRLKAIMHDASVRLGCVGNIITVDGSPVILH